MKIINFLCINVISICCLTFNLRAMEFEAEDMFSGLLSKLSKTEDPQVLLNQYHPQTLLKLFNYLKTTFNKGKIILNNSNNAKLFNIKVNSDSDDFNFEKYQFKILNNNDILVNNKFTNEDLKLESKGLTPQFLHYFEEDILVVVYSDNKLIIWDLSNKATKLNEITINATDDTYLNCINKRYLAITEDQKLNIIMHIIDVKTFRTLINLLESKKRPEGRE